jgi:hypothetical protein
MLIGIFALNEKLKPFLNPEGIKQLAEAKFKLLGGPENE